MPPPSLSWWRDTELIDDTYEEVNGQTINTLEMKNVTREDQETVMECRLAELFLSFSIRQTRYPFNWESFQHFLLFHFLPIVSFERPVKNDMNIEQAMVKLSLNFHTYKYLFINPVFLQQNSYLLFFRAKNNNISDPSSTVLRLHVACKPITYSYPIHY